MKCDDLPERSSGKTKILLAEDDLTQASIMKDFLERVSGSLEMLERVDKEIQALDRTASRYKGAMSDIERISSLSADQSREFLNNLRLIEEDLRRRISGIVGSAGKDVVEQGKRFFMWGSLFISAAFVVLFILHYFGIFYPDPDWLRKALFRP